MLTYLPYFFDDDVSFGIADKKTYLRVQCNPNLNLRLKEGDGIPIHNEQGKVEGCIVIGKSLVKRNEIINISQTLSSTLGRISASVNNLSLGVQDVVNMNNDILSKAQEADESSKDTDGILSFIQAISSQTNMLGLNAAIEAARAGRGFKVVATEIRKLSTFTSESVKKVDSVLKDINESIKR